MNRPGSTTGNWSWRLTEAQLIELAETFAPRLRQLHERYHRLSNDTIQRDFSAPPARAASSPTSFVTVTPPHVRICDATQAAP